MHQSLNLVSFLSQLCSNLHVSVYIQLWVSQFKNGYRPIGIGSEDSDSETEQTWNHFHLWETGRFEVERAEMSVSQHLHFQRCELGILTKV